VARGGTTRANLVDAPIGPRIQGYGSNSLTRHTDPLYLPGLEIQTPLVRVAVVPGPAASEIKNRHRTGKKKMEIAEMTAGNTAVADQEVDRGRGGFHVAVRHPRGHVPQAVGVMTAGALVDRFEVPQRDHRRREGYQRPLASSRVNKLAADLRAGQIDIPTALLLNIRQAGAGVLELTTESDGIFRPDGHTLYVVDGQHRLAALAKLVEDDPDRWSGYEVSFVCMIGATELEEMRQFYIVNSTAKSVRTDLALDLLKQQAESNPELMASLIEKGEDWKVEGQTITEALSRSRLWKDRIRFPGDPVAETTIGSAGMVSSLKQVLATPYFGQISTENQLRILEAYWAGIELVIPEAFREPTAYAIQKSGGVMIMHALLVSVIELLRSRGLSVVEPDSYAEVLTEPLLTLEGDNAEGDIARGADFWLAGVRGAAGSFSSNAGRRVLRSRLSTTLPAIEIE
jgi:DGQHR domain-containing protein